jgi:hypothetical protein
LCIGFFVPDLLPGLIHFDLVHLGGSYPSVILGSSAHQTTS